MRAGRGRPAPSSLAERAPRVEVAGFVFRVTGLAARDRVWVTERFAPFVSRRAPTVTVAVAATERYRRGRVPRPLATWRRSEEHTSELQSLRHLVCRLLLEKQNKNRARRRVTEA